MFSKKVEYSKLNARQKEIYNFQKVSAVFADHGYTTMKLSDDWMGADFIAISFDGSKHLKVQLKGRLTFGKKYKEQKIFVCFCDKKSGNWYLYNHDEMLKNFIKSFEDKESWKGKKGVYHYPSLSKFGKECLKSCILG